MKNDKSSRWNGGQNGGQTSTHIGITIKILLINVGKIKPANLVVKMTARLAGFYFWNNCKSDLRA